MERPEAVAAIERALLSPQACAVLVHGQRRMGKTSLLNSLPGILPRSILPLVVDLQGLEARGSDLWGFLIGVSKAMARSAVRSRGVRVPALERAALNPLVAFDRWLDRVEAAVEEPLILLALDEVEALEPRGAHCSSRRGSFPGLLGQVAQQRQRFRILFAASHPADELGTMPSYLPHLHCIRLGRLSERGVRQLAERPRPGFALRYSAAAREAVFALTGGHPHLVQSLCYEIVSLKNEQGYERRFRADAQDVEVAAKRTLKASCLFFLDIAMNQLSPQARRLAARLAQGSLALTADTEAGGLDLLLRREVLEDGGGTLGFPSGLIRRWFAGPNRRQTGNADSIPVQDEFNHSSISIE